MTDPAQQRVSCTIADGVAQVRLNRPDKLNALDPEMFSALAETGLRLHEEPRVRAVVLSGEGRSFCAGLDFESFRAMAGGGGPDGRTPHPPIGPAKALGQQAVHVWRHLPVPVIAAVRGVAYGGGLQLALGADIRVVAPGSRLSVLEIKWGLVPDMTGTQVLPELVGRDVAKELTFTGRVVGGAEAVSLGLATKLADDPAEAALELAAEIAGKNPDAVRHAKRLLDAAGQVDLEEGFAAEQRALAALLGTPNQIEAVQAAFGDRAPEFTDPDGAGDA
ncbi:crotonase/enoyl-CoA hydratase family protein [Saccharopolyspora sp. NFXS83]|uniref:crotonase/enoyl-CoA hydratase family protein n=1 Tax=Saccharopolyspora sp. NFXS83 TaxID=2993560 RepID=UPI00224B2FE3|nr:crotonase/enoyl-CoA hydratase family protein [Saccharopolyspora sp. NFXS83]MCX2730081.1 crotonase/enoyl-CoA hydratase family protein [Saccharopolyspora sp. NFXS83]